MEAIIFRKWDKLNGLIEFVIEDLALIETI